MHAGGGLVQGDSLLGDIPSGRMDQHGDVNLRRVMRILEPRQQHEEGIWV